VVVARGKSLSWLYDVLLKKERPVAEVTRHHVEELRHVSRAGHPTIVFIWFSQNTVAGGDWSADQYIEYMAKVCQELRRCTHLCICSVVMHVAYRGTKKKVTIVVIGPWCGSKTPADKLRRATELDAAFLQPAARGNGCALSWTEYISLAGCKGAEAKDGSHFTPKGATQILAKRLELNVFKYTNK
jgi:hypothetical protein